MEEFSDIRRFVEGTRWIVASVENACPLPITEGYSTRYRPTSVSVEYRTTAGKWRVHRIHTWGPRINDAREWGTVPVSYPLEEAPVFLRDFALAHMDSSTETVSGNRKAAAVTHARLKNHPSRPQKDTLTCATNTNLK